MHRGHGWWCVVIRIGGPRIVVVRRCPWWYVVVHGRSRGRPLSWSLLCARPSWLWSVVSEHLSSSFVRARSGEKRAFYLPGLSLCNAKEAIPIHHPHLLPCASTSFLTQSSPILHWLGYALTACCPGLSPCGCQAFVARCHSSGDDGGRPLPSVGGGHSWPLW